MPLTIDTDQCESTGVCVLVCPENVLDLVDGRPVIIDKAACTTCWKCVEGCASGAIELD